jgi:hypothetical protein
MWQWQSQAPGLSALKAMTKYPAPGSMAVSLLGGLLVLSVGLADE